MANRKAHTPFRLVPKSWTLNGRYALHCTKQSSFGANHENLNEDRQILSAAKMANLLSGNIRFPGEGRQTSVGLSKRQFSAFSLVIYSETLKIRPALLYSDIEFLVGLSVIPKCMTLNDLEWLFRVKFCFRADLSFVRRCEFRK